MFRSLLGKVKSHDRRGPQRRSAACLSVEPLESRDVLANISFIESSGVVLINGDYRTNGAKVHLIESNLEVSVTRGFHKVNGVWEEDVADLQTFEPGVVTRIVFLGRGGNDYFRNTTSKQSQVFGGDGDDKLDGGLGADRILGGLGSDEIRGFGGDDYISDSSGKNKPYGDGGYDRLYGGNDADFIHGGNEVDTIVTVGGGKDSITGGSSNDHVWMDTTDVMNDMGSVEAAQRYIHKVGQFLAVSFSGGITSTPVSKELRGQNLIDPLRAHTTTTLKNFKTSPLFASDGPSIDDVFQGALGDCYFVASLSAIAKANPEIIRKMVVNLGDGTYAVRFYKNGTPIHVRVDADLWVQNGKPKYAGLGHEDSIWVAIVEKAYCFFRKQVSSYPSLVGGDGNTPGHFGLTSLRHNAATFPGGQQVVDWVIAGRPSGPLANSTRDKAIILLNWVKDQLRRGQRGLSEHHSSYSNTMPLIPTDNPQTKNVNESTWRRGQHVFVVDEVLTNSSGTPTGIVVRNPWGDVGPNGDGYITVTDLARIYFAHSGASVRGVSRPGQLIHPARSICIKD